MGGALAKGIARSGIVAADRITLYDAFRAQAEALAAEIGGKPGTQVAADAASAVRAADVVLIAVKPGIVPAVLAEIAPAVDSTKLVISIAAGVTISKIEALLPSGVPVVRVMPNTPALVGEGASALASGTSAGKAHLAIAKALLDAVGKSFVVDEKLLDAVTGLSGSGPAYVYLIIEALSDGGVKAGLPRAIARDLAAQTVLGSAKMVLETGDHPAKLKDDVTTPGGTTIAGIAELERAGVRSALIDAVEAATERSRELS